MSIFAGLAVVDDGTEDDAVVDVDDPFGGFTDGFGADDTDGLPLTWPLLATVADD